MAGSRTRAGFLPDGQRQPCKLKVAMNEADRNKAGTNAMIYNSRRLAREWKTIDAMLRIYCREQHGGALCDECEALKRYVRLRLDRCRFGEEKPTCAKCPVHCYQRDRREQIRAVMRFAGPRMLW